MSFPTQEQLKDWYSHKSNKEAWIEAQEMTDEEKELESIRIDEDIENQGSLI